MRCFLLFILFILTYMYIYLYYIIILFYFNNPSQIIITPHELLTINTYRRYSRLLFVQTQWWYQMSQSWRKVLNHETVLSPTHHHNRCNRQYIMLSSRPYKNYYTEVSCKSIRFLHTTIIDAHQSVDIPIFLPLNSQLYYTVHEPCTYAVRTR